MKEPLPEFLDRNLPLKGVAACGVRLADRTCVSRCYSDWFAAARVEKAMDTLALAAKSLRDHGLQPTCPCWVFEDARIHLALGRDGGCLAIFAENRPGVATPKLEGLLEEFTRLPAA